MDFFSGQDIGKTLVNADIWCRKTFPTTIYSEKVTICNPTLGLRKNCMNLAANIRYFFYDSA